MTFSDGALFSDGAGFKLWTPQPFNMAKRRLLVFYDLAEGAYERERDFSVIGGSPAHHFYLFEATEAAGSQLDVWIRVTERQDVEGVLDGASWGGPMLPLRWSPGGGLQAPKALDWAADTFGRRHAQKVRAALAGMCARLWAGVPR